MTWKRRIDQKPSWMGMTGCLMVLSIFAACKAGAVTVPNVTGLSLTAAQNQLTAAGLYAVVTTSCSDEADVNTVLSQNPVAGATVDAGSNVTLVIANGPCTVSVPEVVGLTSSNAQTLLQSALLYVTVEPQCNDTIPAQTVFSQNPAAGERVNVGTSVVIAVSTGPCSLVPSVIGYPEQQARQIIESAGFFVSGIQRQCSDLIAIGDVANQIPAGGSQAGAGSGVVLTVSNGRCTNTGGGLGSVLVPTVIGLTEVEASSRIRAAGLVPGSVTRTCTSSVPSGVVMTQDPAPLTSLAPGGIVVYQVSAGPCVVVPNVVGLNRSDAISALTAAGLAAGEVTYQCQVSGTNDVVLSQSVAADTQVNAGTSVALTVSDVTCVTVPNVVGLALNTAQSAVTAVNLYINITASVCDDITISGILSQTPAAGSLVNAGSTVDVVTSSGPCPVTVPDVLGKTETEARSLLTEAGLVVKVESECNNRVKTGSVIRQVPLPNATVDPGSEVTIGISTGKCPVILPGVVGLSYEDARGELINAGIDSANIQVVKQFRNDIPANQVISQSPEAETEVPADTVVTLVISRGTKPPAPDNAAIEQALYDGFVLADRNNDGRLTFEEVLDVLPGLTQDVFNTIDANGDGGITREELARFLRIGGCFGCLRNLWPFKMMAGDLLLFGVSLMTLAAASVRRVEQ